MEKKLRYFSQKPMGALPYIVIKSNILRTYCGLNKVNHRITHLLAFQAIKNS